MPAEGRGRAGQLARRGLHGCTRGRTDRVHATRRARRTSKKGGATHQRRPVRGRGAATSGLPLPAQAGGALIEQLNVEVEERLRRFENALNRLDSIPGVGRRTAETVIAEIGLDMTRFPTAGHLASWAGMCPGNNESAGKRKSGKTRKGNAWLRTALIEAAHASSRARHTYLGAQYHRLITRRGKKKAVVAVGHTILTIAYHLLADGTDYADLGPHYFDERDEQDVTRRLVNRLEALGYSVQ